MVNIRKTKTALKFDTPASWWISAWREALPAGNGMIGASVYGGAGNDTVMLSHNGLSWQGYVGVLPDVADKLKEVRKKLEDGEVKKAETVLSSSVISKNYRPQSAVPLPLCDFKIKMPLEKPARDYMRVLNMDNGEVSVAYRDGTTKYDRSMFVSRENDCIVYEINRSGNKAIDVEFSLEAHDRNNNRTPNAVSKLPEGIMTKYENFFMYFSGRDENGGEFGAVARISHYGGSQTVTGKSIRIKGANNVLVIIKLFVDSQREKEWKNLKAALAANKSNYDKMLKEHTSLHSKLFNSLEFDLEAEDRDLSIEDLLRMTRQTGEVPDALIEKLWAFGRYLFISGTRENGQILKPYGLWCGDYKAVSAQATADGTLQMLYSHAFQGGYENYVLSIFNYYENVLDDLKKNAMRLYGCRGIFIPSVVSPGMGLPGSVEPGVLHFTGCAGWIAQLYYDYYLFTDDKKFLKERALPFMKEVALFYEDFMKVGDDGLYLSSPSYSPNTTPGNYVEEDESVKLSVCQNATVDFAILKELLVNLIEGSEAAAMNKNEVVKWKDMLGKVPAYKINEDGAVSEYITSRFTDNYNSKTAAHLYPVFPGREVADDNEPELAKAFSQAAKRRLSQGIGAQTSWSLANLANVLANLGDGDTAMDALGYMVKCFIMGNLVMAENDWRGMGIGTENFWAPYQIQGNMGFTSAVQRMLVNSRPGLIKLLPSLPADFKKGSIKGLATRAGAEVTMAWDKRKGSISVSIKSRKTNKVDLIFPEGTKKIAKGPKMDEFDPLTYRLNGIELQAGKAVLFEVKWSPSK